MPGTPHAPMIQLAGEIGTPGRALRGDTGYVLTSFLQRLSFDVEKILFSTARTHIPRSAQVSGDNFHFHFMAKTLLEDEVGQPFPDADAALRHAKILAAQLSAGGHLIGCTIMVARDDQVLFEVPLSNSMN